jgi:lipid-A-disaccharide synthase
VPKIAVYAGRTPELIRLAQVAWAVSGSVGLELMAEGLPSVVLYKIKRFDLWLARPFIKAKYISLVNLLADTEVFPEYLTWRDVSNELAGWALEWLDDPAARARVTAALDALRARVAQPGASDRAADRILAWLRQYRDTTPAAAAAAVDRPAAVIRGPTTLAPAPSQPTSSGPIAGDTGRAGPGHLARSER